MHIQNLNLLKIYALATLLLSSIVFSDEPLIVDVRSLEEVKTGIIQDAIHIEWKQIDKDINFVKYGKKVMISIVLNINIFYTIKIIWSKTFC